MVIDTLLNGLYNRARDVIGMDSVIAVYKQGVLRPFTSLALAENTRVRLQIIEQVAEADVDHPLLTLANLGESVNDESVH